MGFLRVSPLIGSNMILQQGVSVPVWGLAEPEAEVAVSFMGKIRQTRADSGGKWRLFLDKQVSGGPHTMEISADNSEKLIIDNIYIGDVWICSGQSNMELPMQRVKDNFPEEWKIPVNSLIRQFKVPQQWEFSGPRDDLTGGCWTPASSETLVDFSAAAWFFAGEIFEKYHTPIGIINAAWGGTPVEAWMSREALAPYPEKIALGDQYAAPAVRDDIIRSGETVMKAWYDELAAGDKGLAEAWYQPQTDVSGWGDVFLPGLFSDAGLYNFCGAVWVSKEIELGEEFTDGESKIWLGTIVDADTVYVNGVNVGATTYRYPPRKYSIPAGLLHKGRNHIVIRVICVNGGGGVTRDKDFRIFSGGARAELGGSWKFRVGISMKDSRPDEFFFQRQPMGLFNAMIAPILACSCRGILWYQGESNDHDPGEYSALFTAMINDWRGKQARLLPELRDIPFLFVQLPIYGEPEENNESSAWALIREAQRSVLSLPATGMAAGLDLGEWNDLHPVNKKDIGRRLAIAAEKVVFGKPNTAPGPLFRDARRRQGRLLLTFDNCGKGLTAHETPHVSIIAGGNFYRLPAVIESPDCLSVDISAIENPQTVLYAWADNPRDRQLYNSDGLPVIPFRAEIG